MEPARTLLLKSIKDDEENFADWTRKLPNGMFFLSLIA